MEENDIQDSNVEEGGNSLSGVAKHAKPLLLASIGCGPLAFIFAIPIALIIIGSVMSPFEANGNYAIGAGAPDKYGEKKTENWAQFEGDDPEKASFYKKIASLSKDYYEKYGAKIDIPLISSLVFYQNPLNIDEDSFNCIEEKSKDEEGNEVIGDCVQDTQKNKISATKLYKEAKKLASAMIKDERLISEDEYKEWLKNNYIEDKLKDLGMKIPSDLKLKEKTISDAIEEIYQLRDIYVDISYGDKQQNSCDFTAIDDRLQATDMANMSRQECINVLGPIARNEYIRTGILASITIAQAIEESGCGKSDIAQKANNLFGMKAFPPGNDYWSANDFYDTSSGKWRKYSSVGKSIADHSQTLLSYGNVADKKTPAEQVAAIQQKGYCAGCPGYEDKILQHIKEGNLEIWDSKTPTEGCNGSLAFYDSTFENKIIYWNQCDPRYGSQGIPYANNSMCQVGCGIASTAIMMSSFLNQNIEPFVLANKYCTSARCTSGGTYGFEILKLAAGDSGLKIGEYITPGNKVGEQRVLDALKSGKSLVMTRVQPGTISSGVHFVVLTGTTKDGKITMVDPAIEKNNTRFWDFQEVLSQTMGFQIISK